MKVKLLAVLIIAAAGFLAVSSAWRDSVIVDEVPHIGAGYSYLVKQDMRLNPEHPPLAKDLAAVPLLFLHLKQDVFNSKFWQSDLNGQWEFGRALMFTTGNDADRIKHAAKLPMLIFFVGAVWLVFAWTRRLYGDRVALIATALFTFSPTVIAHSRFVTTDVPALFGVTLATYFFLRFLEKPTHPNTLLSGLTLGVALLTKFSTFLLLPFFLVLALINAGLSWQPRLALRTLHHTLHLILIAFLLVVLPVYLFHTWHYPVERQVSDTTALLGSLGNRHLANLVIWLADKPILRALGQYALGLLMVGQRATGGNTTYFLGQISATGWHYYFPLVYLMKEPLAWWGLVIITLGVIMTKFKSLKFKNLAGWLHQHFTEFAMLLWLAIYWGTSIKSNLNIGVRHLLPTYSFVIILVSGRVSEFIKNSKIKNLIIWGLVIWYVVENLSVYPYYLTYFNQLAGGPSGGYRYVVDSNLDWGQDLVRLNDWVKQNNLPKIELDYFGWADPVYYLKDKYIWINSAKYRDAADFRAHNQADGWLAVSAEFLQGSRGAPDHPAAVNYDSWLKPLTPVTVIGHSIFVYRLP